MRLSISLEPAQWQTILTALAEAPWKVAAPLIAEIQRQCTGVAMQREHMNGKEQIDEAVSGGEESGH